jgi:hypothetical protein
MEKLLRWLIFGAAVSLLPLVYTYVDLQLKGQDVTIGRLIANGELLVIVWVLSASAIGELIGSAETRRVAKIVFGGATFIIILSSAMFFSSIAEARAAKIAIDEDYVTLMSIILFLSSLPSCSVCIYSTEP